MKIINSISEWQNIRNQLKTNSIGFVPTMGNLHGGHGSLITKSKRENQLTVVSIFINPTQFGNINDLKNYPQSFNEDVNLLTSHQVDYCFLPKYEELYFDDYQYKIVQIKHNLMEAKHRPGHFEGVLTIILKLANIIKPNNMYFGEKDYQQYLLVKEMLAAFFSDIKIIACPTIRDKAGLALSSRNNKLNPSQKDLAIKASQIFQQNSPLSLIKIQLAELAIHIEYLEEHWDRRFFAYYIDDIRLIDNYKFSI